MESYKKEELAIADVKEYYPGAWEKWQKTEDIRGDLKEFYVDLNDQLIAVVMLYESIDKDNNVVPVNAEEEWLWNGNYWVQDPDGPFIAGTDKRFHENFLSDKDQINEIIRKCGSKWCLYSKKKLDGKRKRLGTHDSKQDAYKQEYAIKKNK